MKDNKYPALPVLIVDDEKPWLRGLSITLERSGGINNILTCDNSRDVMGILARQQVCLILLDLTMPYLSGEELLPMIVQDYPEVPVIVLTGRDRVETAVKCMKSGAFDFFVKTVEEERLIAGVHRAILMLELQGENRKLKNGFLGDKLNHPQAFAGLITRNSRMPAIFKYVEAVATSTQPVLITGESGVGKELVAKAVHLVGCPDGPWVAVNVAGLDDNVFSDTVFGHLRGAFTGADKDRAGMIGQAACGTLFLDEIGDLSPSSQVKLLRLLQEGEYYPLGSDKPKRANARIVFATNHDLDELQAQGKFRKDLYYRLRAHHIQIPPLRERLDDLPFLLDYFLDEASDSFGKRKPTPPRELLTLLSTYHFPGNVRELRSMVFDAVGVHQGGKLSMQAFKKSMGLLSDDAFGSSEPARSADNEASVLIFPERLPTIEETVQLLVQEALKRSQNNITIAAGFLGISRPALSKRLKKAAK